MIHANWVQAREHRRTNLKAATWLFSPTLITYFKIEIHFAKEFRTQCCIINLLHLHSTQHHELVHARIGTTQLTGHYTGAVRVAQSWPCSKYTNMVSFPLNKLTSCGWFQSSRHWLHQIDKMERTQKVKLFHFLSRDLLASNNEWMKLGQPVLKLYNK